MTEDELTELDAFLLSEACDENALSLDEAHGYLTALQLLPLSSDETDWLATIWGTPRFKDEAQQQRLTTLLEGMAAEIATTLRQREPFEPLVVETEDGGELFESHEGWCYGFMLAVEQSPESWQALSAAEYGLLAPMAQLALLADDDEEEVMSEEEYLQWVELIPGAIPGLYALWHPE